MKYFVLILFCSCSAITNNNRKYYLKLEGVSGSLITMQKESETMIDSVYAPNDASAIDSLMLWVYGRQQAGRLVSKVYADKNRLDEYKAIIEFKINSAYAYNDKGENVSFFVPDSIKRESIKRWKVDIGEIDH